jgi:hypothetical protein
VATATWTCASCARTFRRVGQSHECAPALTLETYFASGPEFERPIFDVVSEFIDTLGPVTHEFVQVGVFFRNPSSWVQLRPKRTWVAMTFPMQRRNVVHRTIKNKPLTNNRSADTVWFVANLEKPSDFDADLQALLVESFESFEPLR